MTSGEGDGVVSLFRRGWRHPEQLQADLMDAGAPGCDRPCSRSIPLPRHGPKPPGPQHSESCLSREAKGSSRLRSGNWLPRVAPLSTALTLHSCFQSGLPIVDSGASGASEAASLIPQSKAKIF